MFFWIILSISYLHLLAHLPAFGMKLNSCNLQPPDASKAFFSMPRKEAESFFGNNIFNDSAFKQYQISPDRQVFSYWSLNSDTEKLKILHLKTRKKIHYSPKNMSQSKGKAPQYLKAGYWAFTDDGDKKTVFLNPSTLKEVTYKPSQKIKQRSYGNEGMIVQLQDGTSSYVSATSGHARKYPTPSLAFSQDCRGKTANSIYWYEDRDGKTVLRTETFASSDKPMKEEVIPIKGGRLKGQNVSIFDKYILFVPFGPYPKKSSLMITVYDRQEKKFKVYPFQLNNEENIDEQLCFMASNDQTHFVLKNSTLLYYGDYNYDVPIIHAAKKQKTSLHATRIMLNETTNQIAYREKQKYRFKILDFDKGQIDEVKLYSAGSRQSDLAVSVNGFNGKKVFIETWSSPPREYFESNVNLELIDNNGSYQHDPVNKKSLFLKGTFDHFLLFHPEDAVCKKELVWPPDECELTIEEVEKICELPIGDGRFALHPIQWLLQFQKEDFFKPELHQELLENILRHSWIKTEYPGIVAKSLLSILHQHPSSALQVLKNVEHASSIMFGSERESHCDLQKDSCSSNQRDWEELKKNTLSKLDEESKRRLFYRLEPILTYAEKLKYFKEQTLSERKFSWSCRVGDKILRNKALFSKDGKFLRKDYEDYFLNLLIKYNKNDLTAKEIQNCFVELNAATLKLMNSNPEQGEDIASFLNQLEEKLRLKLSGMKNPSFNELDQQLRTDCMAKWNPWYFTQRFIEQMNPFDSPKTSKEKNCLSSIADSYRRQAILRLPEAKECKKNREWCELVQKDTLALIQKLEAKGIPVASKSNALRLFRKPVLADQMCPTTNSIEDFLMQVEDISSEIDKKFSCVRLKAGEVKQISSDVLSINDHYTLRRLPDLKSSDGSSRKHYRITLNYEFRADSIEAAEEFDSQMYASKVQKCFEDNNQYLKNPVTGDQLELKLQGFDPEPAGAQKVKITVSPIDRTNSTEWNPGDKNDCPLILHETFHNLGLIDEYVEQDKGSRRSETNKYKWVEEDAEIPGHDCRATVTTPSLMADQEDVLDEQYIKKHGTILHAAQFRAVTEPGCWDVNQRYYRCAQEAYRSSSEHGGDNRCRSMMPNYCFNNEFLK